MKTLCSEQEPAKLQAVSILSFPDDSNQARRGSCTVNSCIRERSSAKPELFVLLHQLETPTDTQLNKAMITVILLPTVD